MIRLPIFTDSSRAAGMSLWPFLLIRWSRRKDTALIAHEDAHGKRQAPWALGWAAAVAIGTFAGVHFYGYFWPYDLMKFAPSAWWLLVSLLSPWYWMYLASPDFRFHEEVIGYRAQIAAGGIDKFVAAMALSTKYSVDKTFSECLDALTTES